MGFQYNKDEIKESLSIEQVFDFLSEFGGEPQIRGNIIVSKTICHNHKGEGSHKLYYYDNTKLFKCYTNCDSTFDIFELMLKIRKNEGIEITLFEAIKFIAQFFGYAATYIKDENNDILIKDWKIFNAYDRIEEISDNSQIVELKEYDDSILKYLPRPRILPWEEEGITNEVIQRNNIAYDPVNEGIVIPHYNIDGKLIGIRERTLIKEEETKGKYRPAIIAGTMYNHPLGFTLYNLNNSKAHIKDMKKVFLFESEKSCLLYQSYFGFENDISCACCGSSFIKYQLDLLLNLGVKEVIISFDKQFKELGDEECSKWTKKLKGFYQKYSPYVAISFLFDKSNLLDYKMSPIDNGPENFLQLYKNRIFL